MLRALVLLLLVANTFWWAATHGWLPASWLPFPDPEAEREPQRLQQQVRPEAITVLPASASAPETAAPTPGACLQTGALADAGRQAAAEAVLRTAGIDESRWARVALESGPALRVAGLQGDDVEALRAAAALAADPPSFSACD